MESEGIDGNLDEDEVNVRTLPRSVFTDLFAVANLLILLPRIVNESSGIVVDDT